MRLVLQVVVAALALTCMAQTDNAKTTTKSVDCVVPKTSTACTQNQCVEDGGCARCALLQIALPVDAEVVAVRYYTNRGDPEIGELRSVSPGSLQDASMPAVVQRSTHEHVMVMTTFYNRSSVSDRKAAIEVDYKQKSLEQTTAK